MSQSKLQQRQDTMHSSVSSHCAVKIEIYVSESLEMLIDYAVPFPEIHPKNRIGQDILKQVCGWIFIMAMFLIGTKECPSQGDG